VAAVLALAVALRLVLVSRGGQHYFYDEAKFDTSRGAAELLVKGRVRQALVYAIEPHANSYADHIGYKLAGILPELVELRTGPNPRVPAYFFGMFSVLSVLTLAAIARRLGGSRLAFDATLLAGATSATLFAYSRFIVPYDMSMFFALLATWVGVKRPAGWGRSVAVGALAAWAFFCYYGYWQLAGVTVLIHALWQGRSPGGVAGRLAAAGAGFALVVLGFLALSRLGAGTLYRDMVEITRYQAVGGVDFRSGLNSWAYLFYSERASLFLWLGVFGAAIALELRAGAPARMTALRFAAAGFLAVYLVFIVNSDIRHSLVVHGRHQRQLAPFLILGFGLGLDLLCARWSRGRLAAAAAAAILVLNALATFATPLSQEFPAAFRARAMAVLKGLPPVADGRSYYRLVNVDYFIHEPEILRAEPLETLLASPHPMQYRPFAFEGDSRQMRRLRFSIDHRMRLVRMAVPEAERVRGAEYGLVTLDVAFPAGRAGFIEPLLSVGPRGGGDLFFVRYVSASEATLGFESMGTKLVTGGPFAYAPGERRTIRLFSGSLMAPPGAPPAADETAEVMILRQLAYASVDGRTQIDVSCLPHAALPGEVYAGVNTVESDAAGAQFSGTILSVQRGGHPPLPWQPGQDSAWAAAHIRLVLPPTGGGAAEPLLVAGKPGRAVLGYVRIYPDESAVFGVEVWGYGIFESKPVPAVAGKGVDVEFSVGSLLPDVGDAAWGAVAAERQRALKHSIRVLVGGAAVVDVARDTPDLTGLPVYFGLNPIGGSIVGPRFTGQLAIEPRGEPGR
jgi:hypothetical protein